METYIFKPDEMLEIDNNTYKVLEIIDLPKMLLFNNQPYLHPNSILLVRETNNSEPLILKLMQLSNESTQVIDKRFEQRFRAEQTIAYRFINEGLNHRNIIEYHKQGEITHNRQNFLYIASTYYKDGTTYNYLRQSGCPNGNLLRRWIIETGEAISYIHKADIIHRDITPQNIFLNNNSIVLADFNDTPINFDGKPTQPVFVTPCFSAPERYRKACKKSCDIYSFGVTAFAWMFGWDTLENVFCNQEILNIPITSLRDGIDPEIMNVYKKACADNPKERYSDAMELANHLLRYIPEKLESVQSIDSRSYEIVERPIPLDRNHENTTVVSTDRKTNPTAKNTPEKKTNSSHAVTWFILVLLLAMIGGYFIIENGLPTLPTLPTEPTAITNIIPSQTPALNENQQRELNETLTVRENTLRATLSYEYVDQTELNIAVKTAVASEYDDIVYQIIENKLPEMSHEIATQYVQQTQTAIYAIKDDLFVLPMKDSKNSVYQLYMMRGNGEIVKRITFDLNEYQNPVWSPNGNEIIADCKLDQQSEICLIADVSQDIVNPIRLTNNSVLDRSPSWSTDAQQLAFFSTRNNDYGIYIMNRDGSSINLLHETGVLDTQLTWGSDDLIYFTEGDTIFSINPKTYETNEILSTNGRIVDISWVYNPNILSAGLLLTIERGNLNIYFFNLYTFELSALLETNQREQNPALSPSGLRMLYTVQDQGLELLYIREMITGKIQLFSLNANVNAQQADWYPR